MHQNVFSDMKKALLIFYGRVRSNWSHQNRFGSNNLLFPTNIWELQVIGFIFQVI